MANKAWDLSRRAFEQRLGTAIDSDRVRLSPVDSRSICIGRTESGQQFYVHPTDAELRALKRHVSPSFSCVGALLERLRLRGVRATWRELDARLLDASDDARRVRIGRDRWVDLTAPQWEALFGEAPPAGATRAKPTKREPTDAERKAARRKWAREHYARQKAAQP